MNMHDGYAQGYTDKMDQDGLVENNLTTKSLLGSFRHVQYLADNTFCIIAGQTYNLMLQHEHAGGTPRRETHRQPLSLSP